MSSNFKFSLAHPVFKVISQVTEENGIKAFVIGGFVRDLILERPSKDIDIVVLANGLELT